LFRNSSGYIFSGRISIANNENNRCPSSRASQETQTAALYQQRPAPETGDYFKEDWLRPYVKAPDLGTLSVYGGSDFAVTANGGDYTVHVVVGVDREKRLWLLDLWRQQTSSDVWVESLCDLIKRWRPARWAFEQGQIKSGVGPFLRKRAIERGCWIDFQEFPTRGDKAVRAQSMRGRMAMLGLQVPTNEPWYPALRAELLSFPAGKHDDQVDALGLVGSSWTRWRTEMNSSLNLLVLSRNGTLIGCPASPRLWMVGRPGS
jgi:predicted phage terminase large subunit-like protein